MPPASRWQRSHLLTAAVLAATALSGCRHNETRVERTQTVSVESEPPGAAIFVADRSGRERKGEAPAKFELTYEAKRVEFDRTCWVTPGAGAMLTGIGAFLLKSHLDSPEGAAKEVTPALIAGATGLALGGSVALAGLAICLPAAFEEPTESPVAGPGGALRRNVELELPGYEPKGLEVPLGAGKTQLSFRLEPAGAGAVAASSVRLPPTAGGPPLPAAGFTAGAPQPNAFALIVGIEKYRDLPPPTGARGDAQQFAELARKTLGVPERNVILALDDRAAKSDLEKQLAWLENNVPPGGRVYLFFAGHGAPDPASGTSYLLPYDADPAALDGTALKLSDVTARLGRTQARDVIAFLDSCFSGTGGRSVIAAGTRPLVPVKQLAAAPKVSVLAAVTGAQTSGAWSGGGGLFSHFLLEALGSGRADHDGDGQITLREVSDWIGSRVEREARRDSREQLPSLTPGVGVDPGQAVLAIGLSGE